MRAFLAVRLFHGQAIEAQLEPNLTQLIIRDMTIDEGVTLCRRALMIPRYVSGRDYVVVPKCFFAS